MKASGKTGSNGVEVSDNVERRFEPDIYIHTYVINATKNVFRNRAER